MREDHEVLALALLIERWQGEKAAVYIAEQVGAQALARDKDGVVRWQAVAAAYARLQCGARQ